MRAGAPQSVLDQVTGAGGDWMVVQDVSLVLQKPNLLCSVGTLGSSKTTLLRAVAGLPPLHS